MAVRTILSAMLGGAALAASVGACAQAADIVRLREGAAAELLPVAQLSVDPATSVSPLSLAPAPHRSVQLDANGRWAFRLDLATPAARDQDFRDVQAGAFLRLGPRFSVGGTVGLNDKTPDPRNFRPQDSAPKVRLETKFKF